MEIVGLEAPTKLKLKEGSEEKSTLAVMDFEGRGITLLEARTLTDRLITELARTKRAYGRKKYHERCTKRAGL